MGNVHMWLKVKRWFLLSVAIALPLAGCVKENAVTKHGTSVGEVDELLRTYDGKAAPGTGTDISKYVRQIKTAIEKQFYNPGEYSGKVCSLRIKMAPDGLLLDVQKVSGDADLCHAALEAVKKADFPRPPSPEVYEIFKNAPLDFMP